MRELILKVRKSSPWVSGGIGILVIFILVALIPFIFELFLQDIFVPNATTPYLRLHPFTRGGNHLFILGTDDLGRDVLSRLVLGARVSLGVGGAVVGISLVSGTMLGLLSGVYGGWVDKAIMRTIDLILAFPSILLAIVIVSILGPGLGHAVFAVSLVSVPKFTRVVRSSVLVERKKQYCIAAESFGTSKFRMMFKEILPNCWGPLIVQATLGLSEGILDTAALGFLGLGVKAPLSEWGTMLADARPYIESCPWLVTLPGLCILLVVLSFNVVGEGLQQTMDPRLSRYRS